MKPRTCQNCYSFIENDKGFFFDNDFKLYCGYCYEIIFDTCKKKEINPIQIQRSSVVPSIFDDDDISGMYL